MIISPTPLDRYPVLWVPNHAELVNGCPRFFTGHYEFVLRPLDAKGPKVDITCFRIVRVDGGCFARPLTPADVEEERMWA